tara:strand:+ start:418 stop:750 length:333 start_codon:yes stop_codon:yes gene_type:complete
MGKYNLKRKPKALTKKAKKLSKYYFKKSKRQTKKGKKSPLRRMMSLSNSSRRSKSLSSMSLNSLLPSPVTSPARALRQVENVVNSLSPNNKPRRSTRQKKTIKRYGYNSP